MSTLLAPAPAPAARASAPARLLAVRVAGAAMDGPFRLRSPRFEALLAEHARMVEERERERAALLDALHAAVPAAEDRAARRALLAARRDVFNGRAPGRLPDGAPPALAARVERFAAMTAAEDALWERGRAAVLDELRRGVDALLRDPVFTAALRHASPGLWEEMEHGSAAMDGGLPRAWRGIYGYAARFFGKANPFHLFASIAFPGVPVSAGEECEVVLDASVISGVEREILPLAPPERVRLSLRSWTREGEALRFWVPDGRGWRIVSLRATAAVEAVAGYFAARGRETGRPVSTRAACEAWLRDRLPSNDQDAAGRLLDVMIDRGAIVAYLVDDPDRFADALAGISPAHDDRIAMLGRHHLARTDVAGAARAQAELAELAEAGAAVRECAPAPFYVNRYADDAAGPEHEAAARRVAPDLRALKPFFAAESAFGTHQYVLRAFVRGELGEGDGASAPLLELLRRFLRDRAAVVERHLPERHRSAEERRRLAEWRAAVAAPEGTLSAAGLAALPPYPGTPAAADREEICFNGPLDHASGVFHVSNAWAGEGRFASRYGLRRGADPRGAREAEEGVLDVEISIAPPPNLHYVLRALPTGCGFDARRSHLYARWISPSDVVVAAEDGGVAYRHASTGERLRFHYRGFALGIHLPAEYQLLLLDAHADAFLNPFDAPDPLPAPGEVRHRPGLRVGSVRVRRERWSFRADTLADVAAEGDALRFAAKLREWVRARLRAEADEWYYRAPDPRGSGDRPRFLDLRNPLSAQLFRRALARAGEAGAVSLSVMDPPAGALWRRDGGRYVTELMIEA
ncbi:MAG TPA: hypothetical protein VFR81_08180 [Longimicrobium sp.]|nr:hypothetical protein [Longimicrobium sp.]